jgi:hypothetical protein
MNKLVTGAIIGLVILAVFTSFLLFQPKPTPSGGTMIGESLIMLNFTFPVHERLVINLQNVGPVPIDIPRTHFFLNDTEVRASGCMRTLNPSDSCEVTLTYTDSALVPGEAYALRIVTQDGATFSYSVVYGSSS